MRKSEEQSDPKSCWNKARPDERVFVLLGRDPAAPAAIIAWCNERARLGLNVGGYPKTSEALECADLMGRERAAARLETGKVYTLLAGPAAGALVRFFFVNEAGNADCRFAQSFGPYAHGEVVVARPEELGEEGLLAESKPPEKKGEPLSVLELVKRDFGRMSPAEREEIRLALLGIDTSIASFVGSAVDPWLAAVRNESTLTPRHSFSHQATMVLRRCVMLAEAVLAEAAAPPLPPPTERPGIHPEKPARWLVKEKGKLIATFNTPQGAAEFAKEHRFATGRPAEDVTTELEQE